MKTLQLTFMLVAFVVSAIAQHNILTRSSIITVGFLQVKESANMGLVFKGPDVRYGMKWHSKGDRSLITYEYELGLSVLFSREIPALGFHLKPLDVAYLFKLSNSKLFLGPSVRIEYDYNLYPDLQSGFDYWFTNFSVGVNALYDFNLWESSGRIQLNTSFLGLTSRQPEYRNPHFYDLGFAYAIKHLHQDLNLGSMNDYNITRFEFWWKQKSNSRHTLGYLLEYSGYHQAPEINRVTHSLKLIFNKKNK